MEQVINNSLINSLTVWSQDNVIPHYHSMSHDLDCNSESLIKPRQCRLIFPEENQLITASEHLRNLLNELFSTIPYVTDWSMEQSVLHSPLTGQLYSVDVLYKEKDLEVKENYAFNVWLDFIR